jgi:segregation and condensation protein A
MTQNAELPLTPIARVYGEPMIELPRDLYIPPDALEIMLDAFQGPLDVLLYLIRKQNLDILDIPMAALTRQYLVYVEAMRSKNLELAAEYLVMAAMLMEIKSRMLLPRPAPVNEEEDPRAELVRRLLEYEQIKKRRRRWTRCRRRGATCSRFPCTSSARWSSSCPRCTRATWPTPGARCCIVPA